MLVERNFMDFLTFEKKCSSSATKRILRSVKNTGRCLCTLDGGREFPKSLLSHKLIDVHPSV